MRPLVGQRPADGLFVVAQVFGQHDGRPTPRCTGRQLDHQVTEANGCFARRLVKTRTRSLRRPAISASNCRQRGGAACAVQTIRISAAIPTSHHATPIATPTSTARRAKRRHSKRGPASRVTEGRQVMFSINGLSEQPFRRQSTVRGAAARDSSSRQGGVKALHAAGQPTCRQRWPTADSRGSCPTRGPSGSQPVSAR